MQTYRCTVCNYVYDPVEGHPDSGIEPGTTLSALPDDWVCPQCGAPKSKFEPVEAADPSQTEGGAAELV